MESDAINSKLPFRCTKCLYNNVSGSVSLSLDLEIDDIFPKVPVLYSFRRIMVEQK